MAEAYKELARVYDSLMYDVDYVRWGKYINELIEKHFKRKISILECACGTGKITCELLKAGHSVIATDISQDMLNIAVENIMKNGLHANVVKMDMKKISVNKKVDAIICACDGVNYLSLKDFEKFLEKAEECLNENGLFCLI